MKLRHGLLVWFGWCLLVSWGSSSWTPPYEGASYWSRMRENRNVQFNSDYVTFSLASATDPVPQVVHTVLNSTNTGMNMTGHLMVLKNPTNHFKILPPLGGCPGFVRTTDTAQAAGCVLATNAGFFDTKTGDCLGNLISDSNVIQISSVQNANFGILGDNFVVGYINETTIDTTDIQQLVSGVIWLVRNGELFVNSSTTLERVSLVFVTEIAPRLAIGHNADGELLLIEANGLEFENRGLDLYQFAKLSLNLGAVNAINLDGGGSVTVYLGGEVLNTCSDACSPTDQQYACPAGPDGTCQRAVTTITCVV